LNLELPEGITPAILLRNNTLIRLNEECLLATGDTLYLATPAQHLSLLDRIFVHVNVPDRWQDSAFFGEFVLNGQSDIQSLSQLYGIVLPENSDGQSLDSWIHQHFPEPVVGDRVELDGVTLVVREMTGNTCIKIGLKFND
jgi:cell volume regulation protein A